MRLLQRILCVFGLHDWWGLDVRHKGEWHQLCTCCGKARPLDKDELA